MGQVTHVAGPLGVMRRRDFRMMLVLSLVGHAGLLFALSFQSSSSVMMLPGVVSVELVAAPPRSAPPAPAAVPAPPPPKPIAKKVVLPKEPTAPKPKPKPAVKKLAPPPPEPVERDLNDILKDLRADAGETTPEPVATATATAPAGRSGGLGQLVSPEVAAWLKQAKIHVRRTWVLPPAFRTQALEAHVLVNLDASGNVMGEPRIVRRSGNPWFDEGVVRAIQKASPLPAPPEADEWAFVFIPEDSF